ncbi:unnamed protein product [Schistosoma intercalatum]|nr:unnamed protein product [Schistosoma intercalatum]
MNKTLCESIRWYVSQIKGSNPEDIADGDNFTCVEFNESGELLATGDKAGRVTVFKNNKDTGLYDIYCTFTSHEPEFDYLKSLEIEEKINSITWLQAYSSAHHLLSANDKTIKLWRLSERHYEAYNFNIRDDENASLWDESSDRLNMIGPPIPHIITPDKLRIPKFRKSRHLTIEARPQRFFANAHAYHINAVSVNSDQETFLSADDLRINLWHLDVTNQSFTIVDLKPSNMEDLSEVITCSRFHPVQCNILAYSTSRGLIRLCDMRYRALCDDHVLVFEDPSLSQNLGFFADIIASLSDFRFGHTGNYLLARDYLTLKRRTRLEPLAVIVLSVFMGSISIQLVAESVQAIVRMSQNNQEAPNVNDLALGIMASVIVTKLILWIICFKFGGGMAIDALKTDQRNDILSNAASILFSGLAGRLQQYENLKYLDPVGAILIGSYILYSWYQLGAEQIRNLAGHTANPRFIQKIAFVCLNYHPLIEQLDTIRAFHFGENFLVEVDIVLPKEMCLKEAHDIGEGLQKKLEKLETVERAFVHLDYEFSHRPESEHKIV